MGALVFINAALSAMYFHLGLEEDETEKRHRMFTFALFFFLLFILNCANIISS